MPGLFPVYRRGGCAVNEVGDPVLDANGLTVTLQVRNAGARAGREVVQVYASRPDSAVERPVRWLAGFTAVDVGAGETSTVRVRVGRRAFEHWDEVAGDWSIEHGVLRLDAGRSAEDLRLSTTVLL